MTLKWPVALSIGTLFPPACNLSLRQYPADAECDCYDIAESYSAVEMVLDLVQAALIRIIDRIVTLLALMLLLLLLLLVMYSLNHSV